jgi:drug/metabolite transporter (DMT)-like permease
MGVPDLMRTDFRAVTPEVWLGVVYAGLLGIGLAYLLWYRGVQRIGNNRTAVYSNLVPVAALFTAWIWLGETPTTLQLIGATVILASLTLARLAQSPDPGSLRWNSS